MDNKETGDNGSEEEITDDDKSNNDIIERRRKTWKEEVTFNMTSASLTSGVPPMRVTPSVYDWNPRPRSIKSMHCVTDV